MIVCDHNGFGRGVSLLVYEDYSVELTMNVPPAPWDIDLFYRLIGSFCDELGQSVFFHEGEECTVEQLDALKAETTAYMQRYVKNNLTAGYTVFGCIYPIVIEQELVDSIQNVSEEEAHRMYGEYLHAKQELDCGYVSTMLFRNQMDDSLVARYIVSKDVDMIFPLQKEVPFGCTKEMEEQIVHWSVDLGDYNEEGQMTIFFQCPFDQFCSIVDIEKYPRFDARHVIIRLDNEMVQEIMEKM